jgi:hypothetical protein
MRLSLNRNEWLLASAAAALLLVALFAPAVAQPPHAHDFADLRAWWGLPNALDVLSNLPFAIMGTWGLIALRNVPVDALWSSQRACARLFFVGLLLVAAGSSWYHFAPGELGLAIDRAAMAIAFAGLLGLLVAGLVSDRAGAATAGVLLVLAPASVAAWLATGNVLPWAVVQFGGMPLLLLAALVRPRPGVLAVRWSLVLLAYALAKLCEANDQALYAAGGELLSGHSLKHVVAALAAWPVIHAVAALARGQNDPKTGAAPLALARRA